MASPVTSAEFRKLLTEGLNRVMEDRWKSLPSMRDKLYTVINSDRAVEEFFSVGSVPDITQFVGTVEYLPIAPGYTTKIEPAEFAGGIMFERKLMDDKKYRVLEANASKLVTSANRVQEKYSVRPFANAFSAAFDFMWSEEGVSMCSSSHLTKSGTSTASGFDNSGTSALSKTAVAAARLAMMGFRDDISERIDIPDDLALVVPSALMEAAWEIVKTPKSLDTDEGNANFHYGRYDLIEIPRLDDTSTKNWFLVSKSMMKDSLFWVDRIAPETKQVWDFDTYILKLAIYLRFANGFTDWRWVMGNVVS